MKSERYFIVLSEKNQFNAPRKRIRQSCQKISNLNDMEDEILQIIAAIQEYRQKMVFSNAINSNPMNELKLK